MKKFFMILNIILALLIIGCTAVNIDAQSNILDSREKTNVAYDKFSDTHNSQLQEKTQGRFEKEKEEYSQKIEIENYDLSNKRDKYLLWVEFAPEWAEGECLYPGGYFIDVKEASNSNAYYEISTNSLIPESFKYSGGRVREFSEDGKLVLLWEVERDTVSAEIWDLLNKKTLYYYESEDTFTVCITPDFRYMVIDHYNEGWDYFVDVQENKTTPIKLPPHALSTVVSPDGTKYAAIDFYNVDEVKIKIYDIFSGAILDEIPFGDKIPELRQWHKDNKLVYSTYEGSFVYDVSKKEVKLVGEYFYEPLLSPDGRYIALVRHDSTDHYSPLYHDNYRLYQECGYMEGLYIKNMENGRITQVAPYYTKNGTQIYRQMPVQWLYVNEKFDNDKYRCFQKQDQENYVDVATASSCLSSYYPENVLDGDPSTAWVEAEEENLEDRSNDGRGIGEWIKIHRVETSTKFWFNYAKPFKLSGIKLINGYAKNKEMYKANNRVKKVEVILTDGTSYIFDLKDNTLDFQTLDFGETVETRDVTIKILDIYEGSKFNDTCISEIELITD